MNSNVCVSLETSQAPERAIHKRYQASIRKKIVVFVVLAVLLLVCAVADIAIGSGTLDISQVCNGLIHPSQVSPAIQVVLWEIRMPITLTAVVAGLGLAISGSLMQTALANQLAEPFTLGISAAAGFGAAIAIVFQTSIIGLIGIPIEYVIMLNAFSFSLMTVLMIAFFATRRDFSIEMIVMLGIAIHFIFSSLLGITQYIADADQLQSLIFWSMGSLAKTNWTKVYINCAVVFLSLPIIFFHSWKISALRAFGDNAITFGIPVKRIRMLLLLLSALIAGCITSTIGIVGFIGLVAPHVTKILVGEDQRFALIITALTGSVMMTMASILSKVIFPGVILPIGMVTSLIGVPFFLWLVINKRRGI